jgi:hypothetical protein
MTIDVSAFENADLEFDIDVDPHTLPPVSDQLSFLGQRPPDSQGGAIDWSYLNFPICKEIDCPSDVHD